MYSFQLESSSVDLAGKSTSCAGVQASGGPSVRLDPVQSVQHTQLQGYRLQLTPAQRPDRHSRGMGSISARHRMLGGGVRRPGIPQNLGHRLCRSAPAAVILPWCQQEAFAVANLFTQTHAGAVFNLATIVVFILGLFITLVINRWWSIRTARAPQTLPTSSCPATLTVSPHHPAHTRACRRRQARVCFVRPDHHGRSQHPRRPRLQKPAGHGRPQGARPPHQPRAHPRLHLRRRSQPCLCSAPHHQVRPLLCFHSRPTHCHTPAAHTCQACMPGSPPTTVTRDRRPVLSRPPARSSCRKPPVVAGAGEVCVVTTGVRRGDSTPARGSIDDLDLPQSTRHMIRPA